MDRALRLELRSDPMFACGVRGMLKPVLARLGLTADRIDAVVLAVDEAVTNAMRHSYGGRTDEIIAVECAYDAEWIEIAVADTGRTADPARVARKIPADVSPRDVTPGGLGVQLMYDICDEVGIDAVAPHGNRVALRIKRPASQVQEG